MEPARAGQDLQQFLALGRDPLSHTILDRLTNAGVLITATLHADALARLKRFEYDHTLERESGLVEGSLRIGASPRLIELIEQATVPVLAVFTQAELDRVGGDLAGQAATHRVDPAHLDGDGDGFLVWPQGHLQRRLARLARGRGCIFSRQ